MPRRCTGHVYIRGLSFISICVALVNKNSFLFKCATYAIKTPDQRYRNDRPYDISRVDTRVLLIIVTPARHALFADHSPRIAALLLLQPQFYNAAPNYVRTHSLIITIAPCLTLIGQA